MTREEFKLWLLDLGIKFPDLSSWINALGAKQQTLDCWYSLFVDERLTLAEAMEATKAMFAGRAEAPRAYDRERTATLVIEACKELRQRSKRKDSELETNMLSAKRKRSGANDGNPYEQAMGKKLWGMVEGYTALKKTGATPQEVEAWLNKADQEAFPNSYA